MSDDKFIAFQNFTIPNKKKFLSFLAVLIGVSSLLLYLILPSNIDYPAGSPGVEVQISVATGELGSQIALSLAHAGVIKDAKTFISLMSSSSLGNSIQPGIHRIDTHIPSKQALSEMIDHSRISGLITVLPGSTVQDFLNQLAPRHASVATVASLHLPISNSANSLEGQLGLASYAFTSQTSAIEAISQALHIFESNSLPLLHAYKGFSAYQELIIASMLQIEGDPSDYPKVAQTIYNRLKIEMPLQLNSTVQYATHTQGKIDIGSAQTSVRSAYNTYVNIGLPPTPISNPSVEAITAAQHPAQGDWLYFLTVAPHNTRFTSSYAQFLVWKKLYEQNLHAGKFK
jgi:UPF0755 protein